MKRTLDVRQQAAERAAGWAWFDGLNTHQRWTLGDDFVLGTFDWLDWGFLHPPSGVFLRAVDDARIHWECTS